MATGHAKFTGELGCCLATSGGGAIHLLNGLYDAKLDHQPVVAIIGQQKRMSLGAAFQQEIDPNSLYKDVSSDFVQTCMAPVQARHLVDRACKVALTNRTVATIILPEDVAEEEAVPATAPAWGRLQQCRVDQIANDPAAERAAQSRRDPQRG